MLRDRLESCGKSSTRVIFILFAMSSLYLITMPLWLYYGLANNNGPPLAPEVEYRVKWISDADFQGLDRAQSREYRSEDGRRTYEAGETWRLFRPYYATTPDGRWHFQVLARGPMNNYALRAYLTAMTLPLTMGIIGLVICLRGRNADSSIKAEKPERSFQDLE